MSAPTLPPDTRLGTVHLRVGDLPRQLTFYQDVLGFALLAEDGATAALGTEGGRPLLILHATPGASPAPEGTTGLFHVAFLMPSRADLGAMILRTREQGWVVQGYADHNVSEAAYLTDAEGNGIELYADRSEAVWHTVGGDVFMTTEPLDVPGLLLTSSEPAAALPTRTTVGHVHLRVSTLEAAETFYVERLGFQVSSRSHPGALFVAAGSYHHHLGFNVWQGEGAPRPPRGSLGLASFDLVIPSEEVRRHVLAGTDEGMLFDLDDVGVRVSRS